MNTKDSQFSFLLNGVFSDRELVNLVEMLKATQQKVLKNDSKESLENLPQHVYTAWPKATAEQSLMDQVKAALSYLETVVVTPITLAYQPSYAQLKELTTFLRSRMETPLVLQITVETALGAGFVLQFQGKRVDYSVDTILNRLQS